jgi:hypothetical protein
MARVVCVHGIGAQLLGENQLLETWLPALLDGLRRARPGFLLAPTDVAVAFYGDVFRPPGRLLAIGEPAGAPLGSDDAFERELLDAWWVAAAAIDPAVVPPDARTLARTQRAVVRALNALSASSFFADVAIHSLVADLRQVRRYMLEPDTRSLVQDRLRREIGGDTRVIVGHSLGSVAAYEGLAANPAWPVTTLVTLGSPLAIPNLIFDRLRPKPIDGRGAWPGAVTSWTNIADAGDVVTLARDFRQSFGDDVRCVTVHNGSHAHDARPYLSAEETGLSILRGLDDSAGR